MFYLVRHGETEFNVARRHQGHIDSPLTELGLRQARGAGRALAQLVDPADTVIFSSPLTRASKTAQIIAAALGVTTPIIVDPDLKEIGMGSAEGMTEDEMSERWPDRQILSAKDSLSLESPDGESLAALGKRLRRAMARAMTHRATSRILVFNGVCGRVFRALHLGLEPADAIEFFALETRRIRSIPFAVA